MTSIIRNTENGEHIVTFVTKYESPSSNNDFVYKNNF
jgi:hypothetical protein